MLPIHLIVGGGFRIVVVGGSKLCCVPFSSNGPATTPMCIGYFLSLGPSAPLVGDTLKPKRSSIVFSDGWILFYLPLNSNLVNFRLTSFFIVLVFKSKLENVCMFQKRIHCFHYKPEVVVNFCLGPKLSRSPLRPHSQIPSDKGSSSRSSCRNASRVRGRA